MFEDFVPASGNSWDKYLNSSFPSGYGNGEPVDTITPGQAIDRLPAIGATKEVVDLPTPAPATDLSLILLDAPFPAPVDITTSGQETEAVDAITGADRVVEQAISLAGNALADLATDPDFTAKMNLAFGDTWDAAVAGELAQDWLTGDFSQLPPVEMRASAEINGANGAFSGENNSIYLSREFVAGNADNPLPVVSVLLEEIGHYIDSQINSSDAAGDEGAIFAGVVQGQEFDVASLQALKAEDDTAIVMLDGTATVIEQASPSDFGINLSSASYSRSGNKFVASNGTGGTYLWCTDFAFGRALEKGLVQNYSGIGAKISGNAGVWDDQAGSWGRQARSNSFVVWDPSQGGAGSVGHVGFVERVNSDGSFVISEANWDAARMSFNSRTITPGSNAFNTAKFVYLQQAATTPVDNAGNTLSAARSVTVGSTTSSYGDWVGTTDTNDYYKFTLNNTSNFNLTLNGLSADADVQLLNNSGSTIQSSTNSGTTAENISRTNLSAGTYYVRVYPYGTANTNYNLSLTATPVATSSSAFRGTVDGALNIRSGPGTNFSAIGSLSAGSDRTFDSVARGTTHWDAREQRNDDRWFRLSGSNQWVSAAFITGNPLFNGTADTTLNIRSGPGTNFPVVSSLSSGSGRTFDATTVGTTHWDTREGKNENRWFRLQNTNNWVSAANITGNPTY